MYAIVRTGGKQYRVEEGRAITVERLPAEEGATVELQDVLLIADNGQVTIGTPIIEGARVLAQVEANGRSKKIIVFKYKAKVRTRKKTGHRQNFTRLSVTEILRPGQEPKTLPKPKRARRRKAEEEEAPIEAPAAEVEAPEVEAAVEAPAVEAPAEAPLRQAQGRLRRTRKAAEPTAEAKPRTRRAAPKAEVEALKPRTRRKKPEASAEEKPKTPRRRLIRRKKETE